MQRQGIVSHVKAKARHSSAGHSTAMVRRRAIRQGDTRQKQCGVLTSNARQGEAQQRQGDVRRVVAAHWRRHGTVSSGSVRHGRATAQHITEPLSTAMARHSDAGIRGATAWRHDVSQSDATAMQYVADQSCVKATAMRRVARYRNGKATRRTTTHGEGVAKRSPALPGNGNRGMGERLKGMPWRFI